MRYVRLMLAAVAIMGAGCGKDSSRGPAGGERTPGQNAAPAPSAEPFWGEWRRAVLAGDGEALWRMTCASNRRAIVERTRTAMGSTPESEWSKLELLTMIPAKDLKAMSAERLAEITTVTMLKKMREQPGELEKVEKSTVLGVEADGGRGRVRFRMPDGREMSLVLVLEENVWKADLEASAKAGGGK
ncbi:MAG: hypothetical protein K8T20_00220 [Planctomycetes bacterium]|nr:hypothetical protein [Planctomycetota bacterium]